MFLKREGLEGATSCLSSDPRMTPSRGVAGVRGFVSGNISSPLLQNVTYGQVCNTFNPYLLIYEHVCGLSIRLRQFKCKKTHPSPVCVRELGPGCSDRNKVIFRIIWDKNACTSMKMRKQANGKRLVLHFWRR